jgi:hypothetical protein
MFRSKVFLFVSLFSPSSTFSGLTSHFQFGFVEKFLEAFGLGFFKMSLGSLNLMKSLSPHF